MQYLSSDPNHQIKNTSNTNHVNILLVDDRIENLVSVEAALENSSRQFFKALSGEEALRIANTEEIGLILLDVQMPVMDGFSVARKLRENERTKDISIIFITAINREEKYLLQGFEEGAVDYLFKPLNINLLEAKIRVYERLYLQQRELKAYTEQLKNVNQQMNEFAYIVSHDLKAPLRGIASLGDFIEEELGDKITPPISDILRMIKQRTERMQNLIDGILQYSRMSFLETKAEDVNTHELVTSVVDLLAPHQNIKILISNDLPIIFAQRIKLHEVFQNLISNAIKYNKSEDGTISVTATELDNYWEFTIEDTGIGIKPEHVGKIFSIFHTLQPKDKSESTGIGLTIVKKLVEQVGGEVKVYSEFGKGSQFTFSWPKRA
jgi:signal transduction histidine kinase